MEAAGRLIGGGQQRGRGADSLGDGHCRRHDADGAVRLVRRGEAAAGNQRVVESLRDGDAVGQCVDVSGPSSSKVMLASAV